MWTAGEYVMELAHSWQVSRLWSTFSVLIILPNRLLNSLIIIIAPLTIVSEDQCEFLECL